MNAKIVIIGAILIVIAAFAGYGINLATHPVDRAPVSVVQNVAPIPTPVPTPTDAPPTTQTSQVRWTAPVESASLDLYNGNAQAEAKHYKVGTFTEGNYKGGDIIIVIANLGDPGFNTYHFVSQSGKITLLAKNSDQLYDGDFLDRSRISVDDATVLSDLIFPEKIRYGASTFSQEGDNIHGLFFSEMHDSSDLTSAFVDPKLGTVLTDIPGEKNSNGSTKQNGFYLRAPDGTLRTYTLDIDFYVKNNNVPQITWDDGIANTAEYVDTDRGGCGSENYASVVNGVSQNDLVAAGKTSAGDTVYALKDQNSPILKKIYETDYNPYNAPKISYSQFIQSKPAFFWFDPFGRLIKFQKSEFIPQAECGKPVIYLYPQKTTNVSVKITPQGGLTKSEPEYGSRWEVLANPDGQLTDLHTGNVFPYLFWEGRGGIYETPKKGFIVAAKDVHSFLVEKLTKLGLNRKERGDFMDFWEPRMTGAPYFFVTFLGNREMDAIAPLEITPKPDSVIRVLMDFSPLQKPMPVEGYDIRTPNRNGFTVVEWGGVLR